MKKFFPLCLILIVALVWTVSIAGDEGFLSKTHQPGEAQKAPAIEKERTVAKTGRVAPRIARDDTNEIPFETVAPKVRTFGERMKEIKADGVISSNERAEYEELLSLAAPGVELPMPLNIVSESEVNDSCQVADPIACGDTVWCADLTYTDDDVDWYTFTLAERKQVTIETHPTGTDCQVASMTDTYLELWEAPCDSMIAYNDDINYPTNPFSRITTNLNAGTYAIYTDDYWSDGSYHLSLLCEDIPPVWACWEAPPDTIPPPGKTAGGVGDIEPNDTCTVASEALCEYAYCGDLSTGTDEDWYYVDLPADTTYALHVRVFANDTPNQYAQGGGCDPYVALYKADCTTLVAENEDYSGTFPDAENYDSQIDPCIGGNCFDPGERVYIQILTNYSAPGPYLLIINCEPCEQPVNDDCTDAIGLGGTYPIVDTGTTICASVDCPGLLEWGGIWYTFDLPYAENEIDIQICPTDVDLYNVGIVLMPDCACTTYTLRDAGAFMTCPSTGYQGYDMSFNAYPGPATVYWPAFAADADDHGVDFEFTVNVTETPQDSIWNCIEDLPQYILPPGKLSGGNIDTEPNDTCTTAEEAFCEYAYCGDLSSDADHDWYRVIIPQDGTYGLHVRVFANDTPNQYAQGGGLDPWVGLYASDCVTLVASNDDYNGTFPDAELFDSQIDPGGANCFFPGDTVYIEVMTPWQAPGPYLLIINCVPCEIPTGACCVNEECVATNYETECDALGGQWHLGFDCATYVNCAPAIECDSTAVYLNGDWAPIVYNYNVVQCDVSYPLQFANADDFTLPGTDSVNILTVVAWIWNWNGNTNGPDDYDGVNVTIYNNDAISYPGSNFPAGKPLNEDTLCTHIPLIPGGIVYETTLDPGLFAWSEVVAPDSICRLELPVDVMLAAGVKYWLEVQPIVQFAQAGQAGWMNSDTQTGDLAVQIAEMFGDSVWTVQDTFDLAFCLYGPVPEGCDYVVGDVNGSDSYNGLDITYGVAYLKGGPDPMCPLGSCPIPVCDAFFYCGDVNGSCSYNGLDITYGVAYLKGGDAPVPCPDCPPIGGPASDNGVPETPSVIKAKTIIQKGPSSK